MGVARTCPNCGHTGTEGQITCRKCGAEFLSASEEASASSWLPPSSSGPNGEGATCGVCGLWIPANAKACRHCGAPRPADRPGGGKGTVIVAVMMVLLLVAGAVTLVRIFNAPTANTHTVRTPNVSNLATPLPASPPTSSPSAEFGSPIYCGQLATIAESAYKTKQDGYPLHQIQAVVGEGLAHSPEKNIVAQSVVAVIYGDSTLRSAREAYDSVYQECLR
jgi:hypothetical protein